jgi:hypothetical protein
LAVATLWCLRVGEAIVEREGGRETKSHGRFERSLFRIGLDFLQGLVLHQTLHLGWIQLVIAIFAQNRLLMLEVVFWSRTEKPMP